MHRFLKPGGRAGNGLCGVPLSASKTLRQRLVACTPRGKNMPPNFLFISLPNIDEFLTRYSYAVGVYDTIVVCCPSSVCHGCIVARRCEVGPSCLITDKKSQVTWKSLNLKVSTATGTVLAVALLSYWQLGVLVTVFLLTHFEVW